MPQLIPSDRLLSKLASAGTVSVYGLQLIAALGPQFPFNQNVHDSNYAL